MDESPRPRVAGPEDAGALFSLVAAFYAGEGYAFDLDRSRDALIELLAHPELGRALILAKGEESTRGEEGSRVEEGTRGEDGACARPPADSEGPLLGYLILGFGFSLEFGGRDAFVDELYVVPSSRGEGLGSRLLALAEAESRRAGIRALHLEVETSKTSTYAFYRRLGYRDHDRHLLTKRL